MEVISWHRKRDKWTLEPMLTYIIQPQCGESIFLYKSLLVQILGDFHDASGIKTWPHFNTNVVFTGRHSHHKEIRWLLCHLIFLVGVPLPIRQHHYIDRWASAVMKIWFAGLIIFPVSKRSRDVMISCRSMPLLNTHRMNGVNAISPKAVNRRFSNLEHA